MDSQFSLSRLSRRNVVIAGAIAGFSTALGMAGVTKPAQGGTPRGDQSDDAKILNGALYYEHQAIWAYGVATGKLSDSNVGKAVKALALRNQADHIAHRDILSSAVKQLGGTPVNAERNYDLSSYIQRGEGNLDSDLTLSALKVRRFLVQRVHLLRRSFLLYTRGGSLRKLLPHFRSLFPCAPRYSSTN
jgi:Ferritin-like domain